MRHCKTRISDIFGSSAIKSKIATRILSAVFSAKHSDTNRLTGQKRDVQKMCVQKKLMNTIICHNIKNLELCEITRMVIMQYRIIILCDAIKYNIMLCDMTQYEYSIPYNTIEFHAICHAYLIKRTYGFLSHLADFPVKHLCSSKLHLLHTPIKL